MPGSPSDGRGRWKRRRRGKPKQHNHHNDNNDTVPDDDDEEENNDDDIHHQRETSVEDGAAAGPLDPSPSGPTQSEVLVDGGVRISEFPAAARRVVNRPHSSVMAIVEAERAALAGDSRAQQVALLVLENVSHGQLQALSAEPPVADQEKYVITPPPIMEGRGVVKRFGSRVHVLPMHSDWFSPAAVHRLERQVVPHFFSGKSSEHAQEKYMECRNYIVAKYMDSPEKRLTVTDFEVLVDHISMEDLTRIFRFLDHWGIINYSSAAPARDPRTGGSYLREDLNGEVHVPSAALKSIDSLIKFEKPKCSLRAADICSSLSSHGDDLSDLESRIQERLSENRCNYCSQRLLSGYYQSQKEVDVLLCFDCYHDGQFVSSHSSIDFVRVESTKDYSDLDGESWTDQETLLLLEAMEIYSENWNEIAEHVGTKSKAQCILHFLRMPMEDGLMENIEVPSLSKSPIVSNGDDPRRLHTNSNGSCMLVDDPESRLPFLNSGNPVMALVAFLASAIGPRVAAACAHTSLATLSENLDGSGQVNRMSSETAHNRQEGFHGSMQQKENPVHGSSGQNEADGAPISAEKVKAAAKAGLSAAAMKAKLFADHEEREIQRLSANIINHQLKRLELKLKQFAEIETLLMKECEQTDKARQRSAGERARILSGRFSSTGSTSQMAPQSVPPSMVSINNNNNNMPNNRQVMNPSTPQPSISGYGGNQQPVHPQMPFMPRPQMFPMGSRMPHPAMQGSSSAPPNVMFNTPGNAQPSLNHSLMRSVSGTSSGMG